MLKFGIIGAGAVAAFHAEALKHCDGAALYGIADANKEHACKFALTRGVSVYDTPEELIGSKDIDAVAICTPSGLHAKYAVLAAENGKHIVVEKPMALTVDDCDRVIDACEKHSVKSCIISQTRFLNTIQTMKRAIDEKKLGKIVTADIFMKYYRSQEYYSSSSWRGTWKMDGGGALMNQGIHGIDLLLYLIGDVKTVYGLARTLARDIEVEDTAVAAVEYKCGALGLIQGTTSVYPGFPRRLSVSGTKGTITVNEDVFEQHVIENEDLPEQITLGGVSRSGAADPMNFDTDGHLAQYRDFIHSIESATRPLVDIYEGRRTVKLITAIYESSKTGKAVSL